jgi:energy-converting hydrogenase Eha subunit C
MWSSIGLLLADSFILNVLLAQVCLLLQAIWFNYLFHKADYHEGSSMIPALYYALVTSLISQFNTFSIYTLLLFILLGLFQVFLLITIKESAKIECFNAGFLAGLLVVFNIHFIVFVPFLFLILYAIKPFRFNEYLMLLFGIIFPIYIAAGISYILNIEINANIFSLANYSVFHFHNNIFNAISFLLTAAYILFSFISLRGIMYSTGFKRRKNLNMLIFFFIGMVITITFSGHLDETVFSILFIPVSTFLTLFMLRIRKKRLGEILNVIFVLVTFITNIVRIFK